MRRTMLAGAMIIASVLPIMHATAQPANEGQASYTTASSSRLSIAESAVTRWMFAFGSTDYVRLRRMSVGTARRYADFMVKADAFYRTPTNDWAVRRRPTRVESLGNNLFRTNMVVTWFNGDEPVELRGFVYEKRPDRRPRIMGFKRDGRPLRAYITRGGKESGYGVRTQLLHLYRRAEMDRPNIFAVLRVTNNRKYRTYVDDLAAPLTIRDGVTRYADEGRFPMIRPGRSRIIMLDYASVPNSQRGGSITFMAYGPSGSDYEYENAITVNFGRWPRR